MAINSFNDNDPTVPCKFCGKPTRTIYTKLCNNCWELKKRMSGNFEVAEKILAYLKSNKDG